MERKEKKTSLSVARDCYLRNEYTPPRLSRRFDYHCLFEKYIFQYNYFKIYLNPCTHHRRRKRSRRIRQTH